jgi:uncharacterized peroxidase-related enzyme
MVDETAHVRVPLIDEKDAHGRLAELYEEVKKATELPFVPDMFRLLSSRPDLLETVVVGYRAMFGEGALPRQIRELICAWVSRVNQCSYCVGTHNFFYQVFGGPPEVGDAIDAAETPDDLDLDEKTRVLLRLVAKVSREAYKIVDEDWQGALDAGWTEEELLETFFTAALFNFIVRFVDGLGLGTSVQSSRISQLEVSEAEVPEARSAAG